ncbi:MAG: AMP-binding protein [Dehalococcoidales bacterium]|nr:AMP-binding protein [Dehalococcoidales bacterium]
MNLKQVLEITARQVPQKAALILDSQRISYRELSNASNRVANVLLGLGLRQGDHVAILMPHCPEWVIHYFGIIKAGGTAVLLSSMLKAPEIDSLLRDSDTRILITKKEFSRMLATVLPNIPRLDHILVIDDDSYSARVSQNSAMPPEVELDDDDNATVLYTSGVLGRQKGVVHTHASLIGTTDIVSAGLGRGREDVIIDTVPFFYMLGLSEILLGSIIKGATIVIVPRFTPRAVLEAIERERGTILFGVPAMHIALAMLRDEVIQDYDLSSLRVASTAGAKTSPRLMKILEDKLQLTLCETYGLTELSVVSMSTLSNHKLGTVGKPIGDLKIVDDHGKEVATGEIGEALFKVPWMMKEYYNAPELTAQVIQDGWFHTGDLVRIDEDGYLEYIEKRSFIVVTPSGLKISPFEVEDVLLSHPSVAEAAYVGINDGNYGPVPTAFIVFKPGQRTTANELTRLCLQNLADFKLPRRFEFVDSLPKTGSGKINRRQLKERAD